MICEILSTGEEICCGEAIDTNAAFLSDRLHRLGVRVARHTCVGDQKESLAGVLQEIALRSDICIVTGGLGPTGDDVTAEAAAEAAGVSLQFYPEAFQDVQAYFSKRNRKMNELNKKQAFFPRDAKILKNPIGTAPGFSILIKRCIFYFLPGVPAEMKKMFEEHVLEDIEHNIEGRNIHFLNRTLTVFGLSESRVQETVANLQIPLPVQIGFRAIFPYIFLKYWVRTQDRLEAENRISIALSSTEKVLGASLISTEGKFLEDVVGEMLLKKNATLAVAESCTGGLIAHKITNVPGSSRYFLFSAVTYANPSKIHVLGVEADTILRYGAVHERTAEQMASGVRSIAGSTYGISATGIAGPSGGSPDKPVGLVCVGFSSPATNYARRFYFPELERTNCKEIFAVTALDVLRKELLKEELLFA
jgi:nicotinamide-nucleotide amidase